MKITDKCSVLNEYEKRSKADLNKYNYPFYTCQDAASLFVDELPVSDLIKPKNPHDEKTKPW